jgi:hypothetical protein
MNRSSPHPLSAARHAALLAALLAALGLAASACERPCDELMQRIERCAATPPTRALRDGAGVRQRIQTRCRRANQSRVKECLARKGCDDFLRCASLAVRDPRHRY